MLKNSTCSNCGRKTYSYNMNKVFGENRYLCQDCCSTKEYETKNLYVIHKQMNHNKTYGFEFECIPKSENDKMILINSKYRIIPTSDGSIRNVGGIEFKTPTYNNLIGLKSMWRKFQKHVDFSNTCCGQHINIGDKEWINLHNILKIRKHAGVIFNPLAEYMHSHYEDTIKICGRFFTYYADSSYSYCRHSSWINLEHDNRIEFRLSKFVNPNQYLQLTYMWTEIIDCIIENLLKKEYWSDDLDKIGDKLVKIFKKYVDGQADCQKENRNKII